MSLEHETLDTRVTEPLVATGIALEERHARNLEPDEVVRVVRDTLRVRVGKPDAKCL